MKYLTIEQLKIVLKEAGLPKQYASEIIKKRGEKGKRIKKDLALKIINALSKASSYIEKYTPKSFLDDVVFMSEELIIHVDNQFSRLKEKYKPYGLDVPFPTWEEARKWLRAESLEGVLKTSRIDIPLFEGKPLINNYDVYKSSLIMMPYERTIDEQGRGGINYLICNSSPFLLELHNVISLLNDQTGIDEIDLLKYFMCAIKPDIPRAYLLKYSFLHQFFRIQINTIDLTREEWLEIYNSYREASCRKHKKQPSERMMRFKEFLKSMKIPEKPNAEFYRELMHKWNSETGEDIREWRTIRQMHKRIIERKEDMSVLKEILLRMDIKEDE